MKKIDRFSILKTEKTFPVYSDLKLLKKFSN